MLKNEDLIRGRQKMLILNMGDLVLKPSTVIGAAIEN